MELAPIVLKQVFARKEARKHKGAALTPIPQSHNRHHQAIVFAITGTLAKTGRVESVPKAIFVL
jgi:hypothetical protein